MKGEIIMNKEKILKKFTMTDKDVEKYPFISTNEKTKGFYGWLIEDKLKLKKKETLDCRKITVARNIFEKWKAIAKEDGISEGVINMMFMDYAPKPDENLKNNEICLYEGYIN